MIDILVSSCICIVHVYLDIYTPYIVNIMTIIDFKYRYDVMKCFSTKTLQVFLIYLQVKLPEIILP